MKYLVILRSGYLEFYGTYILTADWIFPIFFKYSIKSKGIALTIAQIVRE